MENKKFYIIFTNYLLRTLLKFATVADQFIKKKNIEKK